MDTKYNGWTNYATWRINLEMVDGSDDETFGIGPDTERYELGETIKDWCEELVCMDVKDGLAKDYALAFMSEVNWSEIADHLIETYKENNAA